MGYIFPYIIVHAMFDKNHCFNNWIDEFAGGLWNRPLHGWKYLRARGHLLSMRWQYKTLTTLITCHSFSKFHTGLRTALQGFMAAMSVLPILACSTTWV